jgi:hypothetical protein
MADQKKERTQLIVLGALLLVGALVWYFYFGRSRITENAVNSASTTYTPINVLDYGTVIEKLKSTESTEYKPTGRNIFVASAVPVTPAGGDVPQKPAYQPQGPQPPPPAPPPQLAMKFFGYGTVPSNGERKAFLMDGEEVRIVSEGEIVQNHIRIIHIGNDRIEFEDTNTGLRGYNALEVAPAA